MRVSGVESMSLEEHMLTAVSSMIMSNNFHYYSLIHIQRFNGITDDVRSVYNTNQSESGSNSIDNWLQALSIKPEINNLLSLT